MIIRHPHQVMSRWLLLASLLFVTAALAADPLPSWRAGASKQAIISFVGRVTDARGPEYVSPPERIAVFDNDGTLWAEQPAYFPLLFAFDRLRALAPAHPEWSERPVFKAVLAGDMKGAMAEGEKGLLAVMEATHEGDIEALRAEVKNWLVTARHPVTGRRYDAMVYQPMLEVLQYLRANGFKTYIVTGGDVEFMRGFAERVYGVPHEQVIGSRLKLAVKDNVAGRMAAFEHLNDGAGKVASIVSQIGRRPIAAFGNSDGDLPMLQWTADGKGARLSAYVHHTDALREYAYDRKSHIGKLDKGLDVANAATASKAGAWVIADMARDWAVIYKQ